MSIVSIPSLFYNTTVNVQRRTNAADAIGGLSETWANVSSSVAGIIRPLKVLEWEKLMNMGGLPQGNEFIASFKLFCAIDVDIKANDRIVDTEDSNKEYNVVGVLKFQSARNTISTGHHQEVLLEIPKETHS